MNEVCGTEIAVNYRHLHLLCFLLHLLVTSQSRPLFFLNSTSSFYTFDPGYWVQCQGGKIYQILGFYHSLGSRPEGLISMLRNLPPR